MATLELLNDTQSELINGGYKDLNIAFVRVFGIQKNTAVLKGLVVADNTVEQKNVVAINVG